MRSSSKLVRSRNKIMRFADSVPKMALLFSFPLWALLTADIVLLAALRSATQPGFVSFVSAIAKYTYYLHAPGLLLSVLLVDHSWAGVYEPNLGIVCILSCAFYYLVIVGSVVLTQRLRRRAWPALSTNRQRVALYVLALALSIGVLRLYQFRDNLAAIQVKSLSQPNSTSYVFAIPIDSVVSRFHNHPNMLFSNIGEFFQNLGLPKTRSHGDPDTSGFSIWLDEDSLLGQDIFRDPVNKNDLFLSQIGSAFSSPVYFVSNKPLLYFADYHVHVEALGTCSTVVEVTVVNPRVAKGYRGGLWGISGRKFVAVAPTTVEEYAILLYMGDLLGDTSMPSLNMPRN